VSFVQHDSSVSTIFKVNKVKISLNFPDVSVLLRFTVLTFSVVYSVVYVVCCCRNCRTCWHLTSSRRTLCFRLALRISAFYIYTGGGKKVSFKGRFRRSGLTLQLFNPWLRLNRVLSSGSVPSSSVT